MRVACYNLKAYLGRSSQISFKTIVIKRVIQYSYYPCIDYAIRVIISANEILIDLARMCVRYENLNAVNR